MASPMNSLSLTKPNIDAHHISSWALREQEERKVYGVSVLLDAVLTMALHSSFDGLDSR
jgi:hypothetical protein